MPFDFDQFKGGKRKTNHFRLSRSARDTLERAGGMTVTVIIKARYGAGDPGTIRTRAALSP